MAESVRLDLVALLGGGDRRSIARSQEAAGRAVDDLETRMELVRLVLESQDPIVRGRAADALEKVSRTHAELLRPFRRRLLAIAPDEGQQEVRWHLAQMLPRLDLSDEEREEAVRVLREYLSDHSAIVQAWSLNAILEIAALDHRYAVLGATLLTEALMSESPAVRSRAQSIARRRGQEKT